MDRKNRFLHFKDLFCGYKKRLVENQIMPFDALPNGEFFQNYLQLEEKNHFHIGFIYVIMSVTK